MRVLIVFFTSIFLISVQSCHSQAPNDINVLIFSKTKGFRHSSIPAGIQCIWQLGEQRGWKVTATEDAQLFHEDFLSKFDVVVWLNTTMDVLDEEQQVAFRNYIRSGKGYVGIHAATDSEYDWEWYGGLIGGAFFKTHPPSQMATIIIEETDHPSMVELKKMNMKTWTTFDEWYSFKENPRAKVKVLMSLDENSLQKPGKNPDEVRMGDHPIAWYHEYDGGRSFYTGKGHTPEAFEDALFKSHLRGGIEWAAGR